MAPKSSKQDNSLFDDVAASLMASQAGTMNFIEFVETIVDAFDVPLFRTQRVMGKAIYGLPLEEDVYRDPFGQILTSAETFDPRRHKTERQVMDEWVAERKCNWKPNADLLPLVNAQRIADGDDPIPEFHYSEIVFQCGMRSGKSSFVGLLIAYMFYQMYVHPCPQKMFPGVNLPSSSTIYMTVLASSARQTKGTIYSYVKNYIQDSTFFKTEIEANRIEVTDLDITAPGKHLVIASGHSKADTIVGRTAIGVAFDELAMFVNDDGKTSNASDVYQRVGRATATFLQYSKRIAASSVKQEGDYVEELVTTRWDKQMDGTLIFDLSTFDFNPIMTRSHQLIKGDYEKDPVAAQRDYENIRPGAASSFMNPKVVDRATEQLDAEGNVLRDAEGQPIRIDPERYALSRPVPIFRDRREGKAVTDRADDDMDADIREMSGLEVDLSREGVAPPHILSVGHCDPGGILKDSFGFACGHGEAVPNGIMTVIDLCLEWRPRHLTRGRIAEVDFINIEDVLLAVGKARNLTRLTFDQWNSAGSIQRLFNDGIPTYKLHFGKANQYDMYLSLKRRLADGLVQIPNHPVLVEELKNLLLINGSKVDHPKNKDTMIPGRIGKVGKDLADCVAVVNWVIAGQERAHVRGETGDTPVAASNQTIVRTIGNTGTFTRINWNLR